MKCGVNKSPERWADLMQGHLGPEEQASLEAHAETCEKCREERSRVYAVTRTLYELGEAPPPELSWEPLGIRIGWSVSSETRRRVREQERQRGWARWRVPVVLASGTLVAALSGVLLWREVRPHGTPGIDHAVAVPVAADVRPSSSRMDEPEPVPTAKPLEGIITLLAGAVHLDHDAIAIASGIKAGARIVTEEGRVAVQFGNRSGFLVDSGTTVELLQFDESAVELRVRGSVSAELVKRQPHQRFVVRAGSRFVEVRGTAFRVTEQYGALDVAVTRGRVTVSDDDGSVEVPAGSRIALAPGVRVAGVTPRRMMNVDAKELVDSVHVPLLPTWTSANEMRGSTAVLKVSAKPRVRVRVDGVQAGTGDLYLRKSPGRHLIEAGGLSRWVEAEAGGSTVTALAEERARSERPRQLDAQLSVVQRAIASCVGRVRKVDPLFSGEIVAEIGINADGTVGFVTAIQGTPERDVESCVLSVLRDGLTFPPGTKSTVRKRIRF
ncbi:MAG: FecR domain-containing protein [Deltaproteobacteria bacterium]|nr:FecR domain-containing protein [Deltaproteobacteria bacterium]